MTFVRYADLSKGPSGSLAQSNEPLTATDEPLAATEEPLGATNEPPATIDNEDPCDDDDDPEAPYLGGWRLRTVTLALSLGLFLGQLGMSTVSVSLLTIADSLQQSLSRSTWVATGYLLAYTGFLVPILRLSEAYGRFPLLVLSQLVYFAFSAGCGWARSIAQLGLFRALQGIGACGFFDLTFACLADLVPPRRRHLMSALASAAFTAGAALGPIIAGLVCERSTWRWIFWLNLPVTALTLALTAVAMPPAFPHQNRRVKPSRPGLASLVRGGCRHCFDWPGWLLGLAASVLLIAALENGGGGSSSSSSSTVSHEWDSATVLAPLCAAAVCGVLALAWQRHVASLPEAARPDSVLPWHLLTDRFAAGLLLNALLVGAVFIGSMIALPLRFQAVDGQGPLRAATAFLALALANPLGNCVGGGLVQNAGMPPFWLLQAGAALATAGLVVYAADPRFSAAVDWYTGRGYGVLIGLELLLGTGTGISNAVLTLSVPIFFANPADQLAASGAIGQLRALGGAVAVAALANFLQPFSGDLADGLVPSTDGLADNLLFSSDGLADGPLSALPPAPLAQRRAPTPSLAAAALRREFILLAVFGALALASNMLLVERRPRALARRRV